MQNISESRNVLDDDNAAKLVHDLIASRLDTVIMVMPYYMESQNLKNFNKLRIPLFAYLHGQKKIITFHLFYSVFTGCQSF